MGEILIRCAILKIWLKTRVYKILSYITVIEIRNPVP